MRRYPSAREVAYAFGPGPVSRAVKALLIANVVVFVASAIVPSLRVYLGLIPAAVIEQFWVWQPLSYMFVHGGLTHLAFNMLALWMFGTEMERLWGTPYFLKYYFATGLGAAAATILIALLPFGFGYHAVTIGASGAIYGLLLAFGLTYPRRPIYLYFLFPIPAKYFVLILGGISLLSSITETAGGVAHVAHLGGLVVGYFLLAGGRPGAVERVRGWVLQWKADRAKHRFRVHSGGRGGNGSWDGRVH